MKKLKRNERIGALMKILTDRTNHVFTYNYFTDKFNVAKSTISEDIMIIKDLVKELDFGHIETISGAAGGVKFIPKISEKGLSDLLYSLCNQLSSKDRVIPGGYVYMVDVLYNPYIVHQIGKYFAMKFSDTNIDYVVTVETKGIPIALMTAKILDVPLVIIRRNAKVTEGATVSINYVSGSTKKIQTMSLSRRAMDEKSKVLVIDDFMKAGGTAKGIIDMMKEFKSEAVGIGVLISTENPEKKLVDNYQSLLKLKTLDEENNKVYIEPNKKILDV